MYVTAVPQEHQAAAFEQYWRKDWQDKEPHLLPAKHIAAWIQANLYLRFVPSESTAAYFEALRGYLDDHGCPIAFYLGKRQRTALPTLRIAKTRTAIH